MSLLRAQVNIDRVFQLKKLGSLYKRVASNYTSSWSLDHIISFTITKICGTVSSYILGQKCFIF